MADDEATKTEEHAPAIDVPARKPETSVLVHRWVGEGVEVIVDDDAAKAHVYFETPRLGEASPILSEAVRYLIRNAVEYAYGEEEEAEYEEVDEDMVDYALAQTDGHTTKIYIHLEDTSHGTLPTQEQRVIAASVFSALLDRSYKHGTSLDYEELERRINDQLGAPWAAHVILDEACVSVEYIPQGEDA